MAASLKGVTWGNISFCDFSLISNSRTVKRGVQQNEWCSNRSNFHNNLPLLFRIFLSESNIEYYIVHLGGFLLDLTIGFWLIWSKSRPYAMFFGASFHLMNSQLFSIGKIIIVLNGAFSPSTKRNLMSPSTGPNLGLNRFRIVVILVASLSLLNSSQNCTLIERQRDGRALVILESPMLLLFLFRNVSLHVFGDTAHLLSAGLAQTSDGSESRATQEGVAHNGEVTVWPQTEKRIVPFGENDPDDTVHSQPAGSSMDAQYHPGEWLVQMLLEMAELVAIHQRHGRISCLCFPIRVNIKRADRLTRWTKRTCSISDSHWNDVRKIRCEFVTNLPSQCLTTDGRELITSQLIYWEMSLPADRFITGADDIQWTVISAIRHQSMPNDESALRVIFKCWNDENLLSLVLASSSSEPLKEKRTTKTKKKKKK